jgi:uncharacterized membrane protein
MRISNLTRDRIFIAGLILVAIGLRFYNLGSASLWQDEAFTWARTQQSWLELFTALPSSGNLPLFYVFNKIITDTFGASVFSLRAFSGLVSVLAVPLALILGREVGGKPGMYAAGLFWAFHPMLIWYGTDAKPYSLTVFLALALLLVFLRLSKGMSGRRIWYVATSLLALGQLSHYYFFIFGGTLTLIAIANMQRDAPFFRKWMLAWAAGFLPLLGWLLWYAAQPSPSLGAGWIAQPTLADTLGTLWNLISGYGGVWSWPTASFGLASAVIITASLRNRRKQRLITLAVWFGLLTPIFSMWLISQLRPLYMDRYFIVLIPYLLLLIASGSYNLWERSNSSKYSIRLKWSGLLLFAIVSVWASGQVHSAPHYEREDWLGLTVYFEAKSNSAEAVWLSDSSVRLPLAFYEFGEFTEIASEMPPLCSLPCWLVLRQPYTATHAFTQAVSLSGRPWIPDLPNNCQKVDGWESSTGVALLLVECSD